MYVRRRIYPSCKPAQDAARELRGADRRTGDGRQPLSTNTSRTAASVSWGSITLSATSLRRGALSGTATPRPAQLSRLKAVGEVLKAQGTLSAMAARG